MTQTPTTSIEERDLIRRLLLRHENAWKEFVHRFERLIFSQVGRTVHRLNMQVSNSEIEDICAIVFSQLLQDNMKSLRSFNGRSKLGTWLTVITRRASLRELVGKRQQVLDESLQNTVAGNQRDALSELIRNEDQDRLKTSMESLGNTDREILTLFYEQNMGYKEISAKLGISVNTVGPKLTRAHKRLRKKMRWS